MGIVLSYKRHGNYETMSRAQRDRIHLDEIEIAKRS